GEGLQVVRAGIDRAAADFGFYVDVPFVGEHQMKDAGHTGAVRGDELLGARADDDIATHAHGPFAIHAQRGAMGEVARERDIGGQHRGARSRVGRERGACEVFEYAQTARTIVDDEIV
ncbi:hypothetical protein RZS08_37470, partial [Arthrospira platensis SPKY1]|nr:hypothetical protein [Arthrospira platensis SPKY1]